MPAGTGKARSTATPRGAQDIKTVYAAGTLAGIRLYLPCRVGSKSMGMRYGGKNGLEIIGEERKPPSKGIFIVLDSCGDYHWTRTLLNHMLPQRKVNLLLSCWGRVKAEQVITVRSAVIDNARRRLVAAGLDRTYNPVENTETRTWKIGDRRPVRMNIQH